MDIKSKSVSLNKFKKCGELYRSPTINDKQYMFLSCIYCEDISWELDTFLQHLHNTHQTIDEMHFNFYNGKEINTKENSPGFINTTETNIEGNQRKLISSANCETDPLDEIDFEYSELLQGAIKIENSKSIKCEDFNLQPKTEIIGKNVPISKIGQINVPKYENYDKTCNEYYKTTDKISTDYEKVENTGESCNEEHDQDDDVNVDDIAFDSKLDSYKKSNLKYLTKNREFIKFLIKAYQKQNILWDSIYKTNKCNKPEKQEAYKTILKDIKEKCKITLTVSQIERTIKRLKMRFAHHLRLKDKAESFKPLWFFELLTFLEPHLKGNKMKSVICKELNENQFLQLVKLLKENECFWNENNIYHTSIINKQEILKRITEDFSKIFDLNDFNVDSMQNSINEIIEMAKKENSNKLQRLEASDESDEYQSSNKFYKEIEFLLPHVGPFKCKYCPKNFTDIYAYKFHISRHEGIKPFKCMECPRELTHKKEFVCHLRRHTKECPFQCNVCDKSFPSQKEWHRHVIKHGSKPYVCELCADSFYTQHQLTNHMKNHNNIKDHVCPECGKGFTHRGLLRQHLQTHNKTKCFCTLCNNIYSNPRSLRKHYVRVHETGQQPTNASKTKYNCQTCKITFATIQDAKQHRKEHRQSNPIERKHVCDICGHRFAYPRNLADHKKTHSNIRDQVCDVCGKAFTNANLLNQHKNVHTGEKFVCKACGKDYAHYRGLCRHITKVHSTNIKDLDAVLEKQNATATLQ